MIDPKLIDLYFELKAQEKELKGEIEGVKKLMKADKPGVYVGKEHMLEVVEVPTYTYDMKAILSKIGIDSFVSIATITKEKLISIIPESELADFIKSIKVSIRLVEKKEEAIDE